MSVLDKYIAITLITLAAASCATANVDNGGNGKVRNVIYIIGDGMGLAQASVLEADTNAFSMFTNTAVVTTASANNRVTDSAAGATALFTGHKTNNSWLGMTPDSTVVTNLAERCEAAGIRSGFAVLCSFIHATPAGFYAHSASRDADNEILGCFAGAGLDVVIAGGSKYIDPEVTGSDSLAACLRDKGYNVVLGDTSFIDRIPADWDNLILLPYAKDYPPYKDRGRNTLANSTRAALEVISRGADKGFLLMVEESQIDWVCHDHDSEGLAGEMRDMNGAMLAAKEFADRNPGTLVIAVADHETGGLTVPSNDSDFRKGESGISHKWSTYGHTGSPVILYAYGTGAEHFRGWMDNTRVHDKICELLGI